MVGAVTASALLLIVSLVFWLLVLAAMATFAYAAWQAYLLRDANFLWALPFGILSMAAEALPGLPGYVWVALVLVLWLEWRLARLETALDAVARAITRLRRRKRDAASIRDGDEA